MKHTTPLGLLFASFLFGTTARASDAPGEESGDEAITWSSHVHEILQRNCESCHRPGQVAPFSLQTYEKARGWAEMIASVVEEERMPPWNADERYDGVFANERGLTSEEKAQLLGWVEAGMPRGNPDQDPDPIEWPEGWRIGEPDVVITPTEFRGEEFFGDVIPIAPEGFEVPREGVVEYKYFAAKTDYAEDRWIQAMEVRPGSPDVVHHALILVDDPNATPRERRRQLSFTSYLAAAAPGDLPTTFPEGYAKRLPAGATLVFQLHYTPNGQERFDLTSLGIVFAPQPPLFEVVTSGVIDLGLRIPPGAENHEVRAFQVLEEDTGIVSLAPHMHTRGKDFRYVAHYSDGTSEELLLANYDFNWQEVYILPDPYFLPEGTRLECIAHYDNSAQNPNNPDPEAWVEWGDQSFHEMFIGYYDYVRPLEE